MKLKLLKSITLLTIVIVAHVAKSQRYDGTVEIKEISDNPEDRLPKLNINFEFLSMNVYKYTTNSLDGNAGIWMYLRAKKSDNYFFAFEKSYRSILRIENPKFIGNYKIQAGYIKYFHNRSTNRNETVTLSEHKERGFMNQQTIVKKTTEVNVTTLKHFGLRFGIAHQGTGTQFTYIAPTKKRYDTISSNLYSFIGNFGIQKRYLMNKIMDIPEYGGRRALSYAYEVYIDGLIGIKNNLVGLDGVAFDKKKLSKEQQFPLGVRIGFNKYEVSKYRETKHFFPFYMRTEIGIRPFYGLYFTGGIGVTIVKNSLNKNKS